MYPSKAASRIFMSPAPRLALRS